MGKFITIREEFELEKGSSKYTEEEFIEWLKAVDGRMEEYVKESIQVFWEDDPKNSQYLCLFSDIPKK